MKEWLVYIVTRNYLISVPLFAWFCAQFIKFIIDRVRNKKFTLERLLGSGGMPSSHSATVMSLAVCAFRKFGEASPIFAVCLILAIIVMYDAMGVRRSAGEQARILNEFFAENPACDYTPFADGKKLKELIGHTPRQTFLGALLGLAIGVLIPVF